MRFKFCIALALAVPSNALVRFHCSQLVIERLDPLVTPGMSPSPHVHQIVGTYFQRLIFMISGIDNFSKVVTLSMQRWN